MAVGRSESGHGYDYVALLFYLLSPLVFAFLCIITEPDVSQIGMLSKVINVPARCMLNFLMVRSSCKDAARAECTADVDIKTGD